MHQTGVIVMENVVGNQGVSSDIGLSLTHKCSNELNQISKNGNVKYSDTGIYRCTNGIGRGDTDQAQNKFNGVPYGVKYFGTTFAVDGTYVKLERQDVSVRTQQIGGGLRGNTYGMSFASRKRLQTAVAKINQSRLPKSKVITITLTYGEDTEANKLIRGKEYKRHLKNITQAITRKYGGFGIWRWELQRRLSGHYHFLWCGVSYICHKWLASRWNEIIDGSEAHLEAGVQVERVDSWQDASIYASKMLGYMCKDDSSKGQRQHMKDIHIGRVWGICNRQEYEHHVELVEAKVEEDTHNDMIRAYRGLMKSVKCKKGDYKGWKELKKWMGSWMKLPNLKIEFYMHNETFLKLLEHCNQMKGKKFKRLGDEVFKNMKDRSKRFSKLDAWRMTNGYGSYAQG